MLIITSDNIFASDHILMLQYELFSNANIWQMGAGALGRVSSDFLKVGRLLCRSRLQEWDRRALNCTIVFLEPEDINKRTTFEGNGRQYI